MRGSPRKLVLLGLALLALSSCTRRATQLLAVVETDVPPNAYRCVRIEVTRLASAQSGATVGFLVPAQLSLPFSSGIVPPDGDARARVEVAVELRNPHSGRGPRRERRVARLGGGRRLRSRAHPGDG